MNGNILNIQRFCTGDGPGIRTTVFLKGCPLHCIWCHNPESQRSKRELLYDGSKCANCLRCVGRCANHCHTSAEGKHFFDRTGCLSCGACLSPLCEALELSGREMSADKVLSEVLKDRIFYDNSGGGLTLSGGEPLYQAEFCTELLRRAKEHGLHTALETCGLADTEALLRTAEYVDLYLFDYKETDPVRHKEFTGADNTLILNHLRCIDAFGKEIDLRCPIIPGINDREDHFRAIAELASSLAHVVEIALEPYHSFGAGKYARLGRDYSLSGTAAPDDEAVHRWIAEIQAHTAVRVIKA